MKGKNKIIAAFVVCGAVVVSVWLIQTPAIIPANAAEGQNASVSLGQNQTGSNTVNTDWQKILVAADPNAQTTSVVPKDTAGSFDDTTLTAQMAKDFFGQYLNVANQGAVTPDQANQIASNVLASPTYTSVNGPVYVPANLQINPKTDTATIQAYEQALVNSLQNGNKNIQYNSVQVLSSVAKTSDQSQLAKLDPIIAERQGIINDLLHMQVPVNAIAVHLALLNAYSNVLANLQAARVMSTDPVRAFAGVSAYAQSMTDLQNAIANINVFFAQKLGTKGQ